MKHSYFTVVILVLAGCSPKPKASVPAPPPIAAKPRVRHLVPKSDDRTIRHCIVTRENANSVDCVCRHFAEKIDSVSGLHWFECREGAK